MKKGEHRKINASELWCWRRLLRVPWTARRSNQSILKQISPECLLEGLMLKLKLQYFGHLMRSVDSLKTTLMLGGFGGRGRRGRKRMRWLDGITDLMDMSLSKDSGSDQLSPITQSCLTLCDPMNRSTPGLPVHHQLPESTQTHVHRVSDAIQPSHPLSSPSPPAPKPSQHHGVFQ